jgi:hypothetical protein
MNKEGNGTPLQYHEEDFEQDRRDLGSRQRAN